MWMLAPTVLGALFSMLPVDGLNADWIAVHNETETVIQWLIPLIPTIGIFILVIKVMMVASVRGRD